MEGIGRGAGVGGGGDDDDRTPRYGEGQTLADYYELLRQVAMQQQPRVRRRRRRPKIYCEEVPSSASDASAELPVCHCSCVCV